MNIVGRENILTDVELFVPRKVVWGVVRRKKERVHERRRDMDQ